MIRRRPRLFFWMATLAVNSALRGAAADLPGGIELFEKRIRPLLVKKYHAGRLCDAMLDISGQLDLTPPAGPTFPTALAADFGFIHTNAHRSVYTPVFRNALPELFEVFDFPSPSLVTGKRNVSTVPTQALFLLNQPFVRQQAQMAARRLLAACAGDDGACLDRAYRLCLGRPPTEAERDVALRHLGAAQAAEAREEAWAGLFHALFASADFRYIE